MSDFYREVSERIDDWFYEVYLRCRKRARPADMRLAELVAEVVCQAKRVVRGRSEEAVEAFLILNYYIFEISDPSAKRTTVYLAVLAKMLRIIRELEGIEGGGGKKVFGVAAATKVLDQSPPSPPSSALDIAWIFNLSNKNSRRRR